MTSTTKDQCIYLAILFVLGALNSQAMSRSLEVASVVEKHKQWMAQYRRAYKDPEEEQDRLKIFKDNVKFIESFNKAATKPYKLRINRFADLTDEEFKLQNGYKIHNGYKNHRFSNATTSSFKYENFGDPPPMMDWRMQGAVTPVKAQNQCACCWAFSAVASVEGLMKIKTGRLTSLSEQEIVDCDTQGDDRGCYGGRMTGAFQFIAQNQGLTTEANYPYQGIQGTCNQRAGANPVATITGYDNVPANDEDALLKAVANQPVSVTIDSRAIRYYSSGVFTGECGTKVDHAVTIVGYGIDVYSGIKYWLAKNSWGTEWGEGGYLRIQRDVAAKEGLCGIAMYASYPTL